MVDPVGTSARTVGVPGPLAFGFHPVGESSRSVQRRCTITSLLHGERGQQSGGVLFAHDQPYRFRHAGRRREQVIGNQLGHSICHAHDDAVGRPFTLSTIPRPRVKISSA